MNSLRLLVPTMLLACSTSSMLHAQSIHLRDRGGVIQADRISMGNDGVRVIEDTPPVPVPDPESQEITALTVHRGLPETPSPEIEDMPPLNTRHQGFADELRIIRRTAFPIALALTQAKRQHGKPNHPPDNDPDQDEGRKLHRENSVLSAG